MTSRVSFAWQRPRYGDLGMVGVNHLPQPGIGPPGCSGHITSRRRRIGHKPPDALAREHPPTAPELACDASRAVVRYLSIAG